MHPPRAWFAADFDPASWPPAGWHPLDPTTPPPPLERQVPPITYGEILANEITASPAPTTDPAPATEETTR